MSLRPITDPPRWDETVDSLGGHPLQQWAWGELKAAHGWRAHRVVVESGDTVIGARSVIGGNVWLTESVPPDTIIMVEEPRLIRKSKDR